jgi:4-hydroxy-3-polyprenylbenzoate decarboxylase
LSKTNNSKLTGPFDSLRDYMYALEARGCVRHIDAIDQDAYEATGLMYRFIDEFGWLGGPAVVFDRVKVDGQWMENPVIANQFGRWEFDALAFGIDTEGLDQRQMYRATLAKLAELMDENGEWATLPPAEVSNAEAPCKEVKVTGDDIDVTAFPFLQTNPADGGRYINTGNVVLEDPTHGRNVGTYRCQVKGPKKIAINPEPNQDGWKFLMGMKERGEPFAKAAVVLGAEPVVYAIGSSKAAGYGQDELAIAGGLKGKPINIVKCETNDIMVPADVEMVIEGEIPFDMEPEGPFGEMYGYIGRYKPENFYMNVTAITYRRNPIFINQFTGVTRHFMTAPLEVTASFKLRKIFPNFVGLHIPLHIPGFCFVSIDKQGSGEGLAVGREVSKLLKISKITIVVDKDVDIHDLTEVLHTVGARWQPSPATHIVDEAPGMSGDPSTPKRGITSRVVIDATRQLPEEGGPQEFGKMNRESLVEGQPDIFDRVDKKWSGLLQQWKQDK